MKLGLIMQKLTIDNKSIEYRGYCVNVSSSLTTSDLFVKFRWAGYFSEKEV